MYARTPIPGNNSSSNAVLKKPYCPKMYVPTPHRCACPLQCARQPGSSPSCALDIDVSSADTVAAAGAGIELADEDHVSCFLSICQHTSLPFLSLPKKNKRTSEQGTGVAATILDKPSTATATARMCLENCILIMCCMRFRLMCYF